MSETRFAPGQFVRVWEPRVEVVSADAEGNRWFRGAYVLGKVVGVHPMGGVAVEKPYGYKATSFYPADSIDVITTDQDLTEIAIELLSLRGKESF